MFDVEHGIALHTMKFIQVSSRGEGAVSWFFSSYSGNLGYILDLKRGWTFKTRVCSATSGLLPNCIRPLRILLEAWQGNRDASRGEEGDPVSLSTGHTDIGIPIYFQDESGTISF